MKWLQRSVFTVAVPIHRVNVRLRHIESSELAARIETGVDTSPLIYS